MRFRLVENITLVEDIQSVKNRYPDIDDQMFYKLISFDPTYDKNRNSVGTYSKWILDRYKTGKVTEGDFGHLKDVLTRFENSKKNLLNKDINSFKSVKELDNYLNSESSYKEQSHRQEVRQNQKDRKNVDLNKDASLVFSGDGFDIWVPHTYAASCRLGKGSTWCTASTENDYYYNYYKNNFGGEYYILINQNDEKEKYQFYFETRQFMDANDYSISLVEFFDNHENIKSFFTPKIKGMLKIPEDKQLSDTIRLSFDADEIANLVYDGRDCISGDSVRKILSWDIYDVFDEYTFSSEEALQGLSYSSFDLTDSCKEELIKFNISCNTISELVDYLNHTDEDDNERIEDILDAVRFAYSDAEYSGSVNQMVQRTRDTIEEQTGGVFFEDNLQIDVTYQSIINLYLSDDIDDDSVDFEGTAEDIAKDLYVQKMTEIDSIEIYEPYGGWYGFDEDEFNEQLEYRLDEIQ